MPLVTMPQQGILSKHFVLSLQKHGACAGNRTQGPSFLFGDEPWRFQTKINSISGRRINRNGGTDARRLPPFLVFTILRFAFAITPCDSVSAV
jgi:hypothetical protein